MSMDNTMEEKRQHTPGPWVWSDDGDGNKWGFDGLSPDVIIGTVEGLIDVDEANARLIAAAPDLLIAAKLADAMMSEFAAKQGSLHAWWDAIFDIRAAIAKAKGTTK